MDQMSAGKGGSSLSYLFRKKWKKNVDNNNISNRKNEIVEIVLFVFFFI
jgi:hypothetical protein